MSREIKEYSADFSLFFFMSFSIHAGFGFAGVFFDFFSSFPPSSFSAFPPPSLPLLSPFSAAPLSLHDFNFTPKISESLIGSATIETPFGFFCTCVCGLGSMRITTFLMRLGGGGGGGGGGGDAAGGGHPAGGGVVSTDTPRCSQEGR